MGHTAHGVSNGPLGARASAPPWHDVHSSRSITFCIRASGTGSCWPMAAPARSPAIPLHSMVSSKARVPARVVSSSGARGCPDCFVVCSTAGPIVTRPPRPSQLQPTPGYHKITHTALQRAVLRRAETSRRRSAGGGPQRNATPLSTLPRAEVCVANDPQGATPGTPQLPNGYNKLTTHPGDRDTAANAQPQRTSATDSQSDMLGPRPPTIMGPRPPSIDAAPWRATSADTEPWRAALAGGLSCAGVLWIGGILSLGLKTCACSRWRPVQRCERLLL